jgi:hypothetical protein
VYARVCEHLRLYCVSQKRSSPRCGLRADLAAPARCLSGGVGVSETVVNVGVVDAWRSLGTSCQGHGGEGRHLALVTTRPGRGVGLKRAEHCRDSVDRTWEPVCARSCGQQSANCLCCPAQLFFLEVGVVQHSCYALPANQLKLLPSVICASIRSINPAVVHNSLSLVLCDGEGREPATLLSSILTRHEWSTIRSW